MAGTNEGRPGGLKMNEGLRVDRGAAVFASVDAAPSGVLPELTLPWVAHRAARAEEVAGCVDRRGGVSAMSFPAERPAARADYPRPGPGREKESIAYDFA